MAKSDEIAKKRFIHKFTFFLNYISKVTKKNDYKYFTNLVLGISIILEYKDFVNNQFILELIKHQEEKFNLFETNFHKSNYIDFYSDFIADVDSDGYWSNYPNLWNENILVLDDYLNKFEFVEKQNLYSQLKTNVEQFNTLYNDFIGE